MRGLRSVTMQEGRVSDEQVEFGRRVKEADAYFFVVRSIDDAIVAMTDVQQCAPADSR
jgi:hypothetical protein